VRASVIADWKRCKFKTPALADFAREGAHFDEEMQSAVCKDEKPFPAELAAF
jgi:hypothetical protein